MLLLWPGNPTPPAAPGQGMVFLWLEPQGVSISVATGGLIFLWQGEA